MEWASDLDPHVRDAIIGLVRDAVQRLPDRVTAWEHLANTLLEQHAYAEAMDVAHQAGARFPEAASIHAIRAKAARALGDSRSAIESARTALRMAPDDPLTVVTHFETSMACGEGVEAQSGLDAVLEFVKTRFATNQITSGQSVLPSLIAGLTRAGRLQDAISLLRDVVGRAPAWAHGVYLLAATLARAGRMDEARFLLDPDRYTRRVAIDVPTGFANDAELSSALAQEIRGSPTLAADPPETMFRHGTQTRPWTRAGEHALQALLSSVRRAVDRYVAALPSDEHPFVLGRPTRASMTVWAVLYRAQGQQGSHIHRESWLSCVYYVAVPPPGATPDAGALVLDGTPDGAQAPWGMRTLVPREGELILFPSWLPHSTRPTGSSEPRISVSFDVIPATP